MTILPPSGDPSDEPDEFTEQERKDATRSREEQNWLLQNRHTKHLTKEAEFLRTVTCVATDEFHGFHQDLRQAEKRVAAYRAARGSSNAASIVSGCFAVLGGAGISAWPRSENPLWHLASWGVLIAAVLIQIAVSFLPTHRIVKSAVED